MTFTTAHFGRITVDPAAVVEFPEGLPGFEQCRRFLPLNHPAADGLVFLQSLESPGLCFLAVPVQTLRADYRIAMTAEDLDLLRLPEDRPPALGREVNALAILSLVEGQPPTANLRSPVVIHAATRRAVQAIRPDERYGCREPLVVEKTEALCW
jgi:flagellar assembly factor FliW